MKACCASCRRSSAPSNTARSISVAIGSPAGGRRASSSSSWRSRASCASRGAQPRLSAISGEAAAFGFSPVTVSADVPTPDGFQAPHYRLIRRPLVSANWERLLPFPRVLPDVSRTPSKQPEARFRARQAASRDRGKTLFTKNLHGSVTFTDTRHNFHDRNRDGRLLPGAEPAGSSAAHWLRIGQEHYAAGRNDDAFAAFQLGLAAVEVARPAARRSRPPPTCIPSSATPAWSAAISIGRRQLQGGAAAGARIDGVLVQSRQHSRPDRQTPGCHRLLSSRR